MKVSELMQAMTDAGAPMEAILIAVRALEQRDAEIEQKRSVERDRKRRQRARQRGTDGTVTGHDRDMTGTVTGHDRDMTGTVTDEPALSRPPLSSPQTPQQTPPTHTHPDGDIPRARKAHRFPAGFPCPDWADPDVWADLLLNRKAKKLTNTETAHRKFVRTVEEMADDEWPPGRLLEAIVAQGWGGAYDPRETHNGQRSTTDWRDAPGGYSGDRRTPAERVADRIGGFQHG